MNRVLIFLAVSFFVCVTDGLTAQELASKTDPIVGQWLWNGEFNLIFLPDGTAKHPGHSSGKWKLVHTNKTKERDYEFVWKLEGGKVSIETLVLSTDYERLDGADQKGTRVWAKRIR